MKTLYSFLLLSLCTLIGNAQIINFPDANFKAKLLASDTTQDIAWNGNNRIKIDANNDGEIEQSEALLVNSMKLWGANITDLTGLEYFTNLNNLDAADNHITAFSQNGLPYLTRLHLYLNNLSTIDFAGFTSIEELIMMDNNLTSISLNGFTNLWDFDCSSNQLASIDLTGCSHLQYLYLQNNKLTTITWPTSLGGISSIGLSGNLFETLTAPNCRIEGFSCSNNPNLRYLNVKDSSYIPDAPNDTFNQHYGYSGCPALEYICVRDADIAAVQSYINYYGYTNCHVNSYCTFNPGGTYYTLQGTNTFDADANGCDSNDIVVPNMKYAISNGLITSTLIAGTSGLFHYDVAAGNYTITPMLENSSSYTISPTTATVNFPAAGSPFTQNFCVTANGTHNDLETVIFPLTPARPGFDATYKIIYKNKGNTTQSGTVSVDYYDPIEDFVSATPNFTSQATNTLYWSFSNLLPFETREIIVTFNLNSSVENPPVVAGNGISHTATITGTTDETPDDNVSLLDQTVVNSFDPNDKTCTEGSFLPVYKVGNYLHYVIRFENTGTANAQNIVVSDLIDTTKFDISTLVPLNGSHPFETKISATNKVEFIFQNINLPFDDANNDGYVTFKIKSLPTLTEGAVINNTAAIFFDYNAPIVTNTFAINVFNPLSTAEFDFGTLFTLSPVPAKNSLTITYKQAITISSLSIYNNLGQVVQVITHPTETVDVSGLKTGTYFIKISTDKGTSATKFIKE